jgi:hypothetical protein
MRIRRRSGLVAPTTLAVAACWFAVPTFQFHVDPRVLRTGSSALNSESSYYNDLTVKELRQLVRESSERGVLSRLKKKQDFIDFLKEEGNGVLPGDDAVPESNGEKKKTSSSTTATQRRKPLSMPPSIRADESKGQQHSSPKDAIFERVYQRYPPVRLVNAAAQLSHNSTEEYEDMRQTYHPIFKGTPAASDMDLHFIGTASCTPGSTRGVSCTALRLNWKRRAAFVWQNSNDDTGREHVPPGTSFQGGTWLFDVGECTQVSFVYLCIVPFFTRK